MTTRRCRHCRRLFIVSLRNSDQKYCSSPQCQKARKRKWQKKKMREDPAYRLNQRDAQERWCQKNPGYWKTYRDEHPEYTSQNRETGTEILFKELGYVNAIRFLSMPRDKREESVERHRKWQESLDQRKFFDDVFSENG